MNPTEDLPLNDGPSRDGPAHDRPSPEKTAAQAIMFANRLDKQYKHLRKWARRTGVSSFRLYDKDIPEIPLAVDLYTEAAGENRFLHIALYERPYEKDELEEEKWMDSMKEAAAGVLDIPPDRVFTKLRRKQRGEDAQYERVGSGNGKIVISEGGSKFLVNLSDYLDTGIFLDHRPLRMAVREESAGKRVLNLFCYTGAFSVHAAAGGASSVTSVDLSKTYLCWAADNLHLNGFEAIAPGAGHSGPAPKDAKYPLVHADVKVFLAASRRAGESWDIIICDPPTFSNSKRATETLDINRDWAELCRNCLSLLTPGGTLYFSTNSRSLKFDAGLIGGAAVREDMSIKDISDSSVPEDFRNRNIHRAWRFRSGSTASEA
jgi:23S rRNA (cytosine1962-C5)-methyltransferase